MYIKINGLILGGSSKYQLEPGIQGLEYPAVRMGDGLYAGRDGGFVKGHFYGHRTIIIKGFFIGDNCEETSQLGQDLRDYLTIRDNLPVIIDLPGGNQYYTEARLTDLKADITSLKMGEFQITLLCSDPILYKSINEHPIVNKQYLDNLTGRNLCPILTGFAYGTNAGGSVSKNATTGTIVISTSSSQGTSGIYIHVNNEVNRAYCPELFQSGHVVSFTIVSDTDNCTIVYGCDRTTSGGEQKTTTVGTTPVRLYYKTAPDAFIIYSNARNGCKLTVSEFQVEVGDTPSEYKPYGATSTATSIVGNVGDAELYPRIIIKGDTSVLQLTNITLGQTLQIDTQTTPNDTVVVDMEKRIITKNGIGINESRTASSSWWGLRPEENEIETTLNGEAIAIIEWKEGYLGI